MLFTPPPQNPSHSSKQSHHPRPARQPISITGTFANYAAAAAAAPPSRANSPISIIATFANCAAPAAAHHATGASRPAVPPGPKERLPPGTLRRHLGTSLRPRHPWRAGPIAGPAGRPGHSRQGCAAQTSEPAPGHPCWRTGPPTRLHSRPPLALQAWVRRPHAPPPGPSPPAHDGLGHGGRWEESDWDAFGREFS